MKNLYKLIACSVILLSSFFSCKDRDGEVIGTGAFEAIETMVSSEVSGEVLSWSAEEGMVVRQGEVLGQVDTLQLALQLKSLGENSRSIRAANPNMRVQTATLQEKRKSLERENLRTQRLFEVGVASQKQLDDLQSAIEQVDSQISALESSLSGTTAQIHSQSAAVDTQREQIQESIRKSTIKAPISGTILSNYVKKGELALPGHPLYTIANLDEMIFRGYISGSEMGSLKLHDKVLINVDEGASKVRTYSGTVVWISPKAEFTPKTVQTKDERNNQVYAVKIKVLNDGYIRIGMYGEIRRAENE